MPEEMQSKKKAVLINEVIIIFTARQHSLLC